MLLLQILRAAFLGAAGLALGNAIALAYGQGHEKLTYAAWFVGSAFLLVAGLVCWLMVHRRDGSDDATSVVEVAKQPINITTHNQSGGTNIGKVHIEGARPSLDGEDLAHHVKTEDGFKSVVALNLRDQFAAEALEVEVIGSTIKKVEVLPDLPASMVSQSEAPLTPKSAGVAIYPPLHSRYLVTVLTDKADTNLKIRPQLRIP